MYGLLYIRSFGGCRWVTLSGHRTVSSVLTGANLQSWEYTICNSFHRRAFEPIPPRHIYDRHDFEDYLGKTKERPSKDDATPSVGVAEMLGSVR